MSVVTPLEPLPIIFDEAAHKYLYGEQREVLAYSVTQVCNRKTPQQMKAIEAKRHEWEPRGNAVHAFGEAMLKGEPLPDPGDYERWTTPLLEHRYFNDWETVATEHRLCDLKRSIGGSLDALGRVNGRLVLLDFKSQSSIKSSPYDVSGQLGGYCRMLGEHYSLYVEECRVCWVKPGKTVISPSIEPDTAMLAFDDCWSRFEALRDLESDW